MCVRYLAALVTELCNMYPGEISGSRGRVLDDEAIPYPAIERGS